MAKINNWFDDDLEEFCLYGIRSNGISENKFVYWLNHFIGFKFCRQDDLDVIIKKEEYKFSLYCWTEPLEELDYYLILNQSHNKNQSENNLNLLFDNVDSSQFLLSKYKIYDYLLKIPSAADCVELNNLSLNDYSFVQNFTLIENLTPKEEKLLMI